MNKIEDLIEDLDDARSKGQILTYGYIQERLLKINEEHKKPMVDIKMKYAHVTVIVEDETGVTIYDIPEMEGLEENVEYFPPNTRVSPFLIETERGIKTWSLTGRPVRQSNGDSYYAVKRPAR